MMIIFCLCFFLGLADPRVLHVTPHSFPTRRSSYVNNAGANVGARQLADLSDEDWDGMQAVNLRGTFQATRTVASVMAAQDGGSIVCVSSIAAHGFRLASNAGYAAMKGGLISFVRSEEHTSELQSLMRNSYA